MFEDDIDWMNAASDCGLVAVCRDLDVLLAPFAHKPRREVLHRNKLEARRVKAGGGRPASFIHNRAPLREGLQP